jgi:hypothetical protein
MSETYTAVIFGREREILGWTDKGTLALADGSQPASFASPPWRNGRWHLLFPHNRQLDLSKN